MNAPLTAPRKTLLAVGGVVLVAGIALESLNVASFYGRTRTVSSSTVTPPGTQVRVDSGNGNVTIHPSTDAQLHIETTVSYGLRKPKITQTGGVAGIRLRADCAWFDSQCEVDYDIAVPVGQDVVVAAGSGDIAVSDLATAAELSTGSGDVVVTRLTGPTVNVRTGSGDIRVKSSRVPSLVTRTGSGDVVAEFAAPPTDVEARTGSGDVLLVVPDAAYAVDVDTGSGDRTIEVPTDPSSELTLLIRTGSGDVRVRPGG